MTKDQSQSSDYDHGRVRPKKEARDDHPTPPRYDKEAWRLSKPQRNRKNGD